jgi:hypothetical protein
MIIKKIALCKAEIKATKMKKDGHNSYSNYDYFTPAQIEKLVYDACEHQKLVTKFDLIRNEYGITGKLTVIDTESYEPNKNLLPENSSITFEMATAIPEIKATNIAQQLGGCVTYTERYLKMSAFGITDNSLDFDTTENTKKTTEQKEYKQNSPDQKLHKRGNYEEKITACTTIEELQKVWESIPTEWKNEYEGIKNLQKNLLK